MNKNVKKICYLGIGIAMYVVLSMAMKIPLISHIQTDFGYIAFGVFACLVGWEAAIVGVIGALFSSLLINGWIPIGQMVGQLVIGIICGLAYKKIKNIPVNIAITIVAVFIGVGLIKTGIECKLYSIPFAVKFIKNCIAWVADTIPMVFGYLLSFKFKKFKILSIFTNSILSKKY